MPFNNGLTTSSIVMFGWVDITPVMIYHVFVSKL